MKRQYIKLPEGKEFVVIEKLSYEAIQKRLTIRDQPSIEKAMYVHDELVRLLGSRFTDCVPISQLLDFLKIRRPLIQRQVEEHFT